MKKSKIFKVLIFSILIIACICNLSLASFNEEITAIEKELTNKSHKLIITDDIENEAQKTIKDTCEGKYLCSLINTLTEDEEKLEKDAEIEQENISYDGDIRGNGLHLLGAYQGLTYYSQTDSRWANEPYTSIGDLNQTLKNSGCGPTSAAMVVSSSKGAILPTTMAKLFVNNGYRTAANGTAWSAFPFIADYFGFDNYAYTTNLNTAVGYLRQGYYIIVSCGNGLFTTNGHYIVLVGINDNTISIYDSYMYNGKFDTPSRRGKVTVSGNTIYCTISNFEQYANYRAFWCYSNDHGAGNTNADSGSPYLAGTYEVTASRLRVRSGPGTNYSIITLLNRGSKQEIDYAVGIWGHLSNNLGWICLDYCSKIEVSDTPPNRYSAGSYKVTASALRVRSGPGTNYRIVTVLYKGSKQGVDYTNGNWGHLMNNAGWICLDYCEKIDSITTSIQSNYSIGRYITTANLHVRMGPGVNYKAKTYRQLTSNARSQNSKLGNYYYNGYKKGVICDVTRINGNWGYTKSGWICLDYCKKI